MSLINTAMAAAAMYAGYALGGTAGAAAGATLAGSVLTNETNKDLASQQRDFSAQQASTTYSRGAEDMARAGLNPILAYANPAQVASYQQPNIQNSFGLAAEAYNNSTAVSAKAKKDLTDAGATEARLPHEVSNLKTINKKLEAEIISLSFGNALTEANTAKATADTGLSHAQTNVATAQAANIRQDTLNKVEQNALTKLQQELTDGQISKNKVEQIVLYADAALKSQQAKTALTQSELNDAQKALSQVRAGLGAPGAELNKDWPGYTKFLEGVKRTFSAIPGLSLLLQKGFE